MASANKMRQLLSNNKDYGRSNNVSALHVACPSCFDLETDEVLGAFHDLIKGEEG